MNVITEATKLLAWVENMKKETFQDLDLEFRVAVDDVHIAVQRTQPVLKANVHTAPDVAVESMETDDEGDPSLPQWIGSAFGGVHIVVIDMNGDALDTPATDAGSTAVWESIKNLGAVKRAGRQRRCWTEIVLGMVHHDDPVQTEWSDESESRPTNGTL